MEILPVVQQGFGKNNGFGHKNSSDDIFKLIMQNKGQQDLTAKQLETHYQLKGFNFSYKTYERIRTRVVRAKKVEIQKIQMNVSLTRTDKRLVELKAKKLGISHSEYLRQLIKLDNK